MVANPFWTASDAARELGLNAWQHPAGGLAFAPSVLGGVSVAGFADVQPGHTIGDFVTLQAEAGGTYLFAAGSPAGAALAAFDEAGFLQIQASEALAGYTAIAIIADHAGAFRVQLGGVGQAGVIAAQVQPGVSVGDAAAQLASVVSAALGAHASVSQAEAQLIDAGWYLATQADVLAAGVDPVSHFVTAGWQEGRRPDAVFDPAWYLAHNPDVAAAHMDPLAHYANFGWHEGRDPSATFSTSGYLAHNADVRIAGVSPLAHYLEFGIVEGRATS